MTHGSLFTGIGGIDLGFEWAGIETKWQVEIDDYCQELLSVRFPHTEKFTDVRKVGSHNLEKVDIISGGFPCQDISVAGKGAGIEGERSGLWTELHRVISELRPRFAFIENVPMLTIRGGGRVISDLAEIGYDAEWQIVGADDVGAWHRRKRIWIVAYSEHNGSSSADGQREKIESPKPTGKKGIGELERRSGLQDASDTVSNTKRTTHGKGIGEHQHIKQFQNISKGSKIRSNITDSRRFWSVEPNVGRVAHGISKRVDRLKGLGNAVVPQIPYIIGKRLKELCQENQAEKH
jgi:DNA (cytosine-5)-methyltransferase 1